jgi:rsbT co-antagonist protein RsbR
MDILARQAADLIEQWQGEENRRVLARSLEHERQLVLRLSAPILRLRERLLLLPLIGVIDDERADAIAGELLESVRKERATIVVIDSSAAVQIGSSLGEWLLHTVEAVRFLGAEVVLTGMPARLASSLLPFAEKLNGVTIAGDLQEGLETATALLT